MAHRFKSADFGPLIGDRFRIHVEGRKRPVTMNLIEVKVHQSDFAQDTSDGAGLAKRGFSLLFRASRTRNLEQNIYTIEHKKLGKAQLFIVPVERKHGGRLYESVFSFSPDVAHDRPDLLEAQNTGKMPEYDLAS